MSYGDGYTLVAAGLGAIILACAAGLAVWRVQFQIRRGRSPMNGWLNLGKLAAGGPVEVIFALVGAVLFLFALKAPHVIEVVGLQVSLCAPTRLIVQRADGGVNNTTLTFIEALNSIDGSKVTVDQPIVEALTHSVAVDGNLRRSLRDATLRTFLSSNDIDLWCQVDRYQLKKESLSAEQKRMFGRVQELLEARLP